MNPKLKKAYHEKGIKGVIRYIAKKIVEADKHDESIRTLCYFLNTYHDITQFPKATGDLRLLQEGDAILLAIVDAVCEQLGLDYWMDWGTLLGAKRHGGFIPWDDDVDIAMTRSHYEIARTALVEELTRYGIEAAEKTSEPMGRIGIGYKHEKTGLWIDIFPIDCVELMESDEKNAFRKRYEKYQKKYHRKKTKLSRVELLDMKTRIIRNMCNDDTANFYFENPEFNAELILFEKDSVFPLTRIKFEDFLLRAPADVDRYLKAEYGKYMEYPTSGIMHHGEEGARLSNWASKSGTDMKDVICELKQILALVKHEK